MKKTYLPLIMTFLILFGCSEDFLDRPPMDSITIDKFFETPAQVDAATALLYGWPWFMLNDKAHWSIGDSRAGNDFTNDGELAQFYTFSVTSSNAFLAEAWVSLWMVIGHANGLINTLPGKVTDEVPRELIDRAVAEALFMRSVAYFYLVRLWGGVPIIENNSEIVFDSRVPRNRIEDVYTLIIRDLEKAIQHLPPSYSGANIGRITSWAAKGMLAKVHLAYSGYNQSGSRSQEHLNKAKELAGDVFHNSGLRLMNDYADLFRLENNNNPESLFAFQWISCMDWGTQNTNQAYFAPSGTITGVGDGWGGYKGPTVSLQSEYEPNDLRRKPTFMKNGDVYPELRKAQGGYTYEFDKTSNPPTLTAVKKYVIGSSDDNGPNTVCFMSTGINTYVLRLADVYLIYAEAILGNNDNTSDPDALQAFNAVRSRAGLQSVASITWEDIRRERRIELAYEAEYWYDLVRWHYYDPQAAVNHISTQERGYYWYDSTTDSFVLESRNYPISTNSFYLPIPQGDSDANPLLLQDPVPYDFGN